MDDGIFQRWRSLRLTFMFSWFAAPWRCSRGDVGWQHSWPTKIPRDEDYGVQKLTLCSVHMEWIDTTTNRHTYPCWWQTPAQKGSPSVLPTQAWGALGIALVRTGMQGKNKRKKLRKTDLPFFSARFLEGGQRQLLSTVILECYWIFTPHKTESLITWLLRMQITVQG